jgi:uncharacterized protein (UPF0261 family)
VSCLPDGRAYQLLAHAVLLSAVRDADFWKVKNKVGAFLDATPDRQVFMARRFLTTEDECGGWCLMAGFDPTLFTVRMQAKLEG